MLRYRNDANTSNTDRPSIWEINALPPQLSIYINSTIDRQKTHHGKRPRHLTRGNPLAITSPRPNYGRISPLQQQYGSIAFPQCVLSTIPRPKLTARLAQFYFTSPNRPSSTQHPTMPPSPSKPATTKRFAISSKRGKRSRTG